MQTNSNNRVIARLKAFYFLYFAALAALFPFLALYYESLGLTGRQIGVLSAIPPLVSLFAASLWGGLADATQRHRRVLAAAMVGVICVALAISFARSLWALLPLAVAYAFFSAPIMPLVDNSSLEVLGERKNQYGRLRLWGSIGWGISAPLVGQVVEQLGLHFTFYGYAALMAVGLLLVLGLPVSSAGIGSSFWQGFRLLMRNRRWIFFLLLMFIAGIGVGVSNSYLFLALNQLGASATLMGLALTVSTVSEIVVFAYSDRLLDRWGVGRVLAASLIAMVIRILAYSVMSAPWTVLVVQLIQGFTFATLWTAGVAYANRVAPAGMGATAQGVFSGVLMGLASAAGALIGGWLYQSVGPFLMFRWVGVGMALALLAAALLGRYATRREAAPATN